MTPRLRSVLAAAAALVVGGSGLAVALRDAGQSLSPPMTCAEWARRTTEAVASEPPLEWFVALVDGFVPTTAVGDRILGACSNGACVAEPQGCPAPVTYTYQRSAAALGWRLYRVRGPRYFAVAWRALATAQPSNARFYSGIKEVAAACVAQFTAAQCRTFLNEINPCWKRVDGSFCRNGRIYGPGQGGKNACSPVAGDTPFACDVVAGQVPEQIVAADFPSDQELDQ
jgi:hypothetical protein